MVDLKTQYNHIKTEIDEAIQNVLNTTAFINGPDVKTFRKSLGQFHGIDEATTCGNGTDALQIALMTLGLEPGDEVILPVHTYVATAEVIALLKLKPVFVDVCPDRFTIQPNDIVKAITKKTKVIVPVHLYGQCAEMDPILEIAKKYQLKVVEDSAQAIGAEYLHAGKSWQKTNTIGDIGALSFFPTKNLGCFGDGGALVSTDAELMRISHLIANHGQQIKYQHDLVGCNSRLDTLQAAILNVKLKYLSEYADRRQELAKYYDEHLNGIEHIQLPARFHDSTHVFNQYTIKVKNNQRDKLKEYLAGHQVPSIIYYPIPLHLQKAYFRPEFPKGSFPVTETLSEEVLSLPMHTEMTSEQSAYIVSVIHDFFK